MKMKPNPKLYRQLSQPFPSEQAHEEAIRAFQEELESLRIKHKIPDLRVIVLTSFERGDDEVVAISNFSWGDLLKHELMLAYAYAQETGDHAERLRLAEGGAEKG